MATLKQYLENSWYRGASQDRQTGYAAQFQYGENINIRDMKNGVCLSGGSTDVGNVVSNQFSYFVYKSELYTVDRVGVIRTATGATYKSISINSIVVPRGIEFGDDMYIISSDGVHKITSGGTDSDITPSDWDITSSICVINYANTFLLVGDASKVYRYDNTLLWKEVRDFESGYLVEGLTQEGNYLKIYTSNGIDTKIHYAKGTFDVEYTGLVQTVSFKGLSVSSGCIASDQGQDYALFMVNEQTGITPDIMQLKLSKISGYHKTDIRWTQTWEGQKIFTSSYTPYITASDGVLFAATEEGIWTFTEYNGWLWGGCIEFKESNRIWSMFRYGEKLYVCISSGSGYKMRYYDLNFHPATYQSSGFIIGRVFDGGCAGLFKKNDQATITYNMPVGTSMELSYRYDRSSFGYSKDNFLSIKKLTDTNECYDIVVPTTPSDRQQGLLTMENGADLILLENGNGIQLEDLLVCPFNKTWNLLEYRFDLTTTDNTKTPILFEHSLTYYDYMRKYR